MSTDHRGAADRAGIRGIVDGVTALFYLLLAAWCGLLAGCDIRSRRLPNPLTVTGALGVLAYAAWAGQLGAALRGAALLALPYLVVHLFRPAALGAGDVKLAVGLGAAAALGGAQTWLWSALAAPLFTAAAALGLLLGQRITAPAFGNTRRCGPPQCPARARSPGGPIAVVPHGPAMCAATLLGLALW
ncbi:A24 family peptidase [Nocardia carnea]|uniref:A24 family peptidase n=1 Tax=Nocardia carnea TaxID=37328 RepID=UPI0024542B11|nr:A24 family peptidase [Nocardia carnea]